MKDLKPKLEQVVLRHNFVTTTECNCGQAYSCIARKVAILVLEYCAGNIKHNHPTRVVMELGEGCAACDASRYLSLFS